MPPVSAFQFNGKTQYGPAAVLSCTSVNIHDNKAISGLQRATASIQISGSVGYYHHLHSFLKIGKNSFLL